MKANFNGNMEVEDASGRCFENVWIFEKKVLPPLFIGISATQISLFNGFISKNLSVLHHEESDGVVYW